MVIIFSIFKENNLFFYFTMYLKLINSENSFPLFHTIDAYIIICSYIDHEINTIRKVAIIMLFF